MFRVFTLLIFLSVVVVPALAQDEPLYVTCGAEEYLRARHTVIDPINKLLEEWSDPSTIITDAQVYVAINDAILVFLTADPPECAQTVHDETVKGLIALNEYIYLFTAANYFELDYSELMSAASDESERTADNSHNAMIDLGWESFDQRGNLIYTEADLNEPSQ